MLQTFEIDLAAFLAGPGSAQLLVEQLDFKIQAILNIGKHGRQSQAWGESTYLLRFA